MTTANSLRWPRCACAALAILSISASTPNACQKPPEPSPQPPPSRDVLLVGNSCAGTVSFLDDRTWKNLGSINIVPDLQDRLDDINGNLITQIAYSVVKQNQVIKHFEPCAGDRFVDDMFVSPAGTKLYVSRSNLGDVVAFDLTDLNHRMLWRTHVDGFKSDHATISPD